VCPPLQATAKGAWRHGTQGEGTCRKHLISCGRGFFAPDCPQSFFFWGMECIATMVRSDFRCCAFAFEVVIVTAKAPPLDDVGCDAICESPFRRERSPSRPCLFELRKQSSKFKFQLSSQ